MERHISQHTWFSIYTNIGSEPLNSVSAHSVRTVVFKLWVTESVRVYTFYISEFGMGK